MTLKKIADVPTKPCLHPEHNPPGHIVLAPGVYEHTCPGCGAKATFTVPQIINSASTAPPRDFSAALRERASYVRPVSSPMEALHVSTTGAEEMPKPPETIRVGYCPVDGWTTEFCDDDKPTCSCVAGRLNPEACGKKIESVVEFVSPDRLKMLQEEARQEGEEGEWLS